MNARVRLCLSALVALALLAVPSVASAKSGDRDHDGLPDSWEKKNHLSTKHKDAAGDPDNDGLTNLDEYHAKTKPLKADSDGDGVADGDEDPDRDNVDNGNEVDERTDPTKADTDGDHKKDGKEDADRDGLDNATEDATGNDPMDADTDGDGVKDGDENAGTVVSYDGESLTLRLRGGARLTGRVDENTTIDCYSEDDDFSDSGDTGDDSGDTADETDITDGLPRASVDGPTAGGGGDNTDDGSVDDGSADDTGDDTGEAVCDDSLLQPGAPVHEATYELVDGQIVFDSIALID